MKAYTDLTEALKRNGRWDMGIVTLPLTMLPRDAVTIDGGATYVATKYINLASPADVHEAIANGALVKEEGE